MEKMMYPKSAKAVKFDFPVKKEIKKEKNDENLEKIKRISEKIGFFLGISCQKVYVKPLLDKKYEILVIFYDDNVSIYNTIEKQMNKKGFESIFSDNNFSIQLNLIPYSKLSNNFDYSGYQIIRNYER